MVAVVGGLAQCENRRGRMTIHALRNKHVPMCAVRWNSIRIAGLVSAIPCNCDVAVSIGRNPGEQVRLSGLRRVLCHLNGRGPARPVIG